MAHKLQFVELDGGRFRVQVSTGRHPYSDYSYGGFNAQENRSRHNSGSARLAGTLRFTPQQSVNRSSRFDSCRLRVPPATRMMPLTPLFRDHNRKRGVSLYPFRFQEPRQINQGNVLTAMTPCGQIPDSPILFTLTII
jgi:hypothetical protein